MKRENSAFVRIPWRPYDLDNGIVAELIDGSDFNMGDDGDVVLDAPNVEPPIVSTNDGIENGGNEQNPYDVSMYETSPPSLASSTGTESGENDTGHEVPVPNQIDAKDFPDNGVELGGRRSINPPGLTGPYKKLRNELFGNTSKTRAARTVSNQWIDDNILVKLQEPGHPQIRFFVKCENGTYQEFLGKDKYSAIGTDIWNMKSNSTKNRDEQNPIVQSSTPSFQVRMFSSWILSKRSLLRTMKIDPVKRKVYEGIMETIL